MTKETTKKIKSVENELLGKIYKFKNEIEWKPK